MRKIISLFSFVLYTNLYAASGIVVVLEAPLMSAPSLDSQVKQTVRRGDKIFLHDQHFNASSWESNSEASQRVQIVDDVYNEEFYQTISRDGLPAYIQAKYVKVIHKDDREKDDPVARYDVDPTDYRLEEPLADGYPLSDGDKRKATALVSMGTNFKTSYPFSSNVIQEKYRKSVGFQIVYSSKVDFDVFDRFYFGAKFGFDNNDIEFTFENGEFAKQSLGRFTAGPYISYDIYKTLKYRLSAFASIALTYHRTYITLEGLNELQEERSFSALGFTPELGAQWQWTDVFPAFDLVAGASLIAQPTTELKPVSTGVSALWNEEQDVLSIQSGLRAMFVVGIQSRY